VTTPVSEEGLPPEPQSAPDRKRRWRMLIILGSISIGWKVLVFTLGAALPKWLIDDGVAALPAEHQEYARSAIETSRGLWNGPIERHGFVRAIRVMRVDTLPPSVCNGLGARVRAYTYFAVPYSEVRTTCESGVVLYRVFKRRSVQSRGAGGS
jgi:hypothetical protein